MHTQTLLHPWIWNATLLNKCRFSRKCLYHNRIETLFLFSQPNTLMHIFLLYCSHQIYARDWIQFIPNLNLSVCIFEHGVGGCFVEIFLVFVVSFHKIWCGSRFVLVFILVCWRIYRHTRQYNQIYLSTASLSWFVCFVSMSLVRASFTYSVGVLFELRVYLHRQPRVSMYFHYMCQYNLSKFVRSMSVNHKRKTNKCLAPYTMDAFHRHPYKSIPFKSTVCENKFKLFSIQFFFSFIFNQLRNKKMPQTCTWYFISSDSQWKDLFPFWR